MDPRVRDELNSREEGLAGKPLRCMAFKAADLLLAVELQKIAAVCTWSAMPMDPIGLPALRALCKQFQRISEAGGWQPMARTELARNGPPGAIAYRGRIVPLLDLRSVMGLEPLHYGPTTAVVILERSAPDWRFVGLVPETMVGVVYVAQDPHRVRKQFLSTGSGELFPGCALGTDTRTGSTAIVLDPDRCFALEETGAAVSGAPVREKAQPYPAGSASRPVRMRIHPGADPRFDSRKTGTAWWTASHRRRWKSWRA